MTFNCGSLRFLLVICLGISSCTAAEPNDDDSEDDMEDGMEDEGGGESGDDEGGGEGGVQQADGKGGDKASGGAGGSGGKASSGGAGGAPIDAGITAPNDKDAGVRDATPQPMTYDPCPPKGTACKVMPLGDSITDISQYREALFRRALAANRKMTYVGSSMNGPSDVDGVPFPRQHEGHSGEMVDDIARLIPASLRRHTPHIVLLMIGTNDADRSPMVATAPARLGKMLDAMMQISPDTLMVVAKIVPTKESLNAPSNQRIQTFNDALGKELDARIKAGKHVVMVDMYGAFTSNPNYANAYMSDHLHPSGAGFGVMADTWWSAVKDFVK